MTQKLFDERWTLLGLAHTAQALPTDATITPLTLANPQPQRTSDANRSLPRLSIDNSPLGSGSPGGHPGADLAIQKVLGEGGMGRVYLVTQHSLGRDVALKTLKENVSEQARAALLYEARVTGSLEHPGVIPVHVLGLDDHGNPLLVMKRVEGVEWRTLIDSPEHPLWSQRNLSGLEGNLEILVRVCETLEFSHSRGVLHLDVKPENVMVGAFGQVYLVDWGIAARVETCGADPARALVGTPAYMAPEMVLGGALDERTDVYLLGSTLHEVLTGTPRHAGATLQAVLLSAMRSEPVEYGADVPDELGQLANRATHPAPEQRPPSVAEFREAISEFLRQRAQSELARAAERSLSRIVALLGEPDVDLALAYQLVTEARFGFAQCLREAPDMPRAVRGAEGSVRALIEIELRQGHADTARALLRELPRAEDTLLARIVELERKAGHEQRETARLRALERDLDPGVSVRARAFGLASLAGLFLGIAGYVGLTTGLGNITTFGMMVIGVIVALVATVAMLVLRRRLLTNTFNTRMGTLLMVGVYAGLVNRTVGHYTHTPVASVVAVDLAVVLGVLAGGAVLMRSLWIAFAWVFAGLIAMRMFPGHALAIFALDMIGTVLLVAALFSRTGGTTGLPNPSK